jgi:hypothetical protein
MNDSQNSPSLAAVLNGRKRRQALFRLPDGLLKDLDALAFKHNLSRNALVEAMLAESVSMAKRHP